MSLIEKYKPKNYDDIIGNNKKYKTIEKDILNNDINKYVINGKSNLGKTNFVEIFSKKNNYKLLKYSIEDDIEDDIFSINFFIKKLILIDDIIFENIKYTEKNKIINKIKKIIDLINKIKKSKNILIIIISDKNIKEFKKINDVCIINLRKYNNDILINHIKKICENENIKISTDTYEKTFNRIIEVSNGNINKIYLNIETLLTNGKKTLRFNEKTRNNIDNRKEDNKINDSFKILSNTFKPFDINNNIDLHNKEQLYYSESFLVESNIRENYIKLSSFKYKKNNLDIINKISHSLSDGDIINNIVNNKQLFILSKYSTFLNGIIPMYLLQDNYKCFFNFPNIINQDNSIINNNKKMLKEKKDKSLFNFNLYEIDYLNKNKLI